MGAEYLVIVPRGETRMFELLREEVGGPGTVVVWDRRTDDQRRETPAPERRHGGQPMALPGRNASGVRVIRRAPR